MTITPGQAERLGRAIRLRTVTIAAEASAAQPELAPFLAFEELLKKEFPRAARILKWEKLGDLALLLTWEPAPGGAAGVAAQVDPLSGRAAGHGAPGLLFYAHYDVVPAGEESLWTRPAFSGVVADGFIWGRGTLDDKGMLLSLLEAVEGLLENAFQPARTVYFAFGGDEETGGTQGALVIARALGERGVRLACVFDEGSVIADGVLPFVPRPVALVGLAEKGFANALITVRGQAGHAAMPGRGTAAGALAAVITALENNPFPLRLTPTVARFFKALAPHARPPLGLALRLLGPLLPLLGRAVTADPTVDALLRTTMATTILRAGDKPNVMPGEAQAVVNLRMLPGETAASALARVREIAGRGLPRRFTVTVEFPEGWEVSDPVPESGLDDTLWRTLLDSIALAAPEAVAAPFLVVMGTDSRKFAFISESIVRLMPAVLTREDIGGIHGVNEKISLVNYARMIVFYRSLMEKAAGKGSA